MKKIGTVLKCVMMTCLIVMMLAVSGCSGEEEGGASGKTKIVVGVTGAYPGWDEIADSGSEKNAGLQGFDIDVWNEIAKRNNWELEFKVAEFSALWGLMDNGQITTNAYCAKTKERAEKYDFADPYAWAGYVLVTKGADKFDSIEWFRNKKVCVEAGSNYMKVLQDLNDKYNLNMEIVYLDGLSTLIPAVVNGSYDAAMVDVITGVVSKNHLNMDINVYDPHRTIPIAFPFLKKPENKEIIEKVNKTIKEMQDDGTLSKLSNTWFHGDFTKMSGDSFDIQGVTTLKME